MFLFAFTDFIGRFHPLLVHLPIGILLFTILLQWLSTKEKWAALQSVIPLGYLFGAASAIASCITGYLLGSAGEYDETVLNLHQWMGILTAFTAIAGYLFSHNQQNLKYIAWAILGLVSITGHLGGTLTHGEGYLTKAFTSANADSLAIKKPLTNAQEALVYADVIEPILKEKCFSCHAASKQKGGLRLDNPEWVLKGGKNGVVLKPNNAIGSELYHRILLDPIEEKHMPPKGKPQVTEKERILLEWWIAQGGDFKKQTKQLEQSPAIKQALASLEQAPVKLNTDLPKEAVAAAPIASLNILQSKGVTVLPVAKGSHYLTANFVNLTSLDASGIDALLALKQQLIWLKMPKMQLASADWKKLSALTNLRKLDLSYSNINQEAITSFITMKSLFYLNLVGTKVNGTALIALKELPELRELYLSGTKIATADFETLKKTLTKTTIDTGGYQVVTLATDTTLIKKQTTLK
ncbi:MAG: hypothetical protein B7Y15_05670 [Bacteroidetes bacterium 24-39-8]|jgi:uncharacterized membrane protein|nr:MAG: hypothetical protein B7Y69_02575 [Sphingobacteriia bacterium 35-40-8]OYZ51493.1 MAG: hypothetical protein B7Y15_05670 [Bacteroidetes bacterium 24-39-8]OZA66220.1 MAG: hypothetical protein B7X72_06305 [Sphingobacteriia bacterium 39-39-8]HQR92473.1 hypothetical protein [Sediminibacterium sp.]HQS55031.1 hypothetical protein [Sediminibacterium sp.]